MRDVADADRLEPDLYRYPAIHAPAFRRAVEDMFRL